VITITASPITINAGSTTASATITVVDDAINENSETVIVTMGSPTNATQGATTVHTATITDNDTAPTVEWTESSQTNAESVTTVTVTAQLSAASGLNVTVPYHIDRNRNQSIGLHSDRITNHDQCWISTTATM
jgi:hypothetical protein